MKVTRRDLDDIRELFMHSRSLRERTGLPFGPDGYTLGSAGEILAAYVFGLDLNPAASQAGVDAWRDERSVQIKATAGAPGKGMTWRDAHPAPHHLLVLRVCPGEDLRTYYNGPYDLVWNEYLKHRKKAAANNTRSVRINALIELDAKVPDGQRLEPVRKFPVL